MKGTEKAKEKRRHIGVVTMIIFLIMLFTIQLGGQVAIEAHAQQQLVGDVDNDSKITINDASLILLEYSKAAAGMIGQVDKEVYDVDNDGVIDINDAYLTLMFYSYTAAGRTDMEWPPKSTVAETTQQTTTTVTTINDVYNYGDEVTFVGSNRYSEWNLRSSPQTDSADNIITTLKSGDKFKIVAIVDDNSKWYQIEYKGLNTLYIQITDKELFFKNSNTTTSVTTTQEPITTQVTTAFSSSTTQTTVTTKPETVTTNSSSATTITTNQNTKSKFKQGQYLKFTGSSWNIRSDTNLDAENSIGKVLQNEVLNILSVDSKENWYLVKNMNTLVIGYVNLESYWYFEIVENPSVTTTKPTTLTTTTTLTTETTTTITNSNTYEQYDMGDVITFTGTSWNVRYSIEGNIKFTIETGDTFIIILDEGNGWYQIAYDGKTGFIFMEKPWIFTKTDELVNEVKITSINDVTVAEFMKFTGTSWYIHNLNGDNVGVITNSQMLAIIQKSGEMLEIVLDDGTQGFIYWNKNSLNYFVAITE